MYNKKKIDKYTIEYPNQQSFDALYKEIFIDEIYKLPKLEKYNILDLGANIGLSIIYFKINYPNSKIIAYEASPETYKWLQWNIKYNMLQWDVETHNQAISESEKIINFYENHNGSGSSNIYKPTHLEYDKIKIQSNTLKNILNKDINIIKMDIEGAEKEILKNKKNIQLIKNQIDCMIWEEHNENKIKRYQRAESTKVEK